MFPYIYSVLTQHNSHYHRNVQDQKLQSFEMICHAVQLPAYHKTWISSSITVRGSNLTIYKDTDTILLLLHEIRMGSYTSILLKLVFMYFLCNFCIPHLLRQSFCTSGIPHLYTETRYYKTNHNTDPTLHNQKVFLIYLIKLSWCLK